MFTFAKLFQIVLSIDPALNPNDLQNLMAHFTTIEVSFFSVLVSTCSICAGKSRANRGLRPNCFYMFYPGYIQNDYIHLKALNGA